ncbi:MAG: Ig-like domain-containing protein [Clostridia bacterium]|nr:Ig-like domain-containing protein [Clostridia bacterium]
MKETKGKILMILIISLIALLCAGRGTLAVTPLKADKESIDVSLNGVKNVYVSGGTGTTTYTSSDSTIAEVNDKGQVTGKKIGTAKITATKGEESVIINANVIYNSIKIQSNSGLYGKIYLSTRAHETENCTAVVKDYNGSEIKDADVTWKSSDTNVVTVDKAGKLTAVKKGTAEITVTAAGVTDSREVVVSEDTDFTDFSNANYETSLQGYSDEYLKITGVQPNDKNSYYFLITADNKAPEVKYSKNGSIDLTAMENLETLWVNTDENYMYNRNFAKYTELNQDLNIWIIEQKKLEESYQNENGDYVYYETKFVAEGKKIERAELPKLNLVMKTLLLSSNFSDEEADGYSSLHFNFPTATKNRKFTLKIGKVTDNAILKKIQNEDYSGITDLLEYAKENEAVYSETLETTSPASYWNKTESLLDGRKLLQHGAYYYIYVEFDDENGKYRPVEGVTLGQAWIPEGKDYWDIWAYTSGDFKWDNLSATSDTPDNVKGKKSDDTVVPAEELPQTGVNLLIPSIVVAVVGVVVISYKKFRNITVK